MSKLIAAEHITPRLRWKDGVLQQCWSIETWVTQRFEWRDVPTEGGDE